jgi:hypothetical protein
VFCWNADNEDIGDEGAIRIAEGLEKNTSLKRLNLQSTLPHCILPSCSSHSFAIESPLFDAKDELCISHFLSLIWDECVIGCGIGSEGAKRIGEMLEKNGSLMKLQLFGEIPMDSHSHSILVTCQQMFIHGEAIVRHELTIVLLECRE